MIEGLLSLIAPHLCISCGQIGGVLCNNCKYDIVKASEATCIFCNQGHEIPCNTICSTTWFVGERKSVLQRLVGSYKFNGLRAASIPLAVLLSETAPPLPANILVTWIPTHPKHIRERGYDHMQRIARSFARTRRLQAACVFTRRTYFVQHHSDRATRLTQVEGAFTIELPLDTTRPYLLLDDIYTTGATVREAARVLKAAGVSTVIIGIIARQPLD